LKIDLGWPHVQNLQETQFFAVNNASCQTLPHPFCTLLCICLLVGKYTHTSHVFYWYHMPLSMHRQHVFMCAHMAATLTPNMHCGAALQHDDSGHNQGALCHMLTSLDWHQSPQNQWIHVL